MNKNFKVYLLIWSILFVTFNSICFLTQIFIERIDKFSTGFWIGYIFIVLAFIGQLVCGYLTFSEENLQKLFYNIPIISISYMGLVFMLIFSSLTMSIPFFPKWLGIIGCLLILAFTAISVIKANAGSDLVDNIDKEVKVKTIFIKSLIVDAESLINRANTNEIKSECRKVYEAIKYSDPMSSDALSSIESQITIKFHELSSAVALSDMDMVKISSNEVLILINDRNNRCKIFK